MKNLPQRNSAALCPVEHPTHLQKEQEDSIGKELQEQKVPQMGHSG